MRHDVKEWFLSPVNYLLHKNTTKSSSVSFSPVLRMCANKSYLSITIKLHPFTSHCNKLSIFFDSDILAKFKHPREKWTTWFGKVNKFHHLFYICHAQLLIIYLRVYWYGF